MDDLSELERLRQEELNRRHRLVSLIQQGSVASPELSKLWNDAKLAEFDVSSVRAELDAEGSTWRVFALEESPEKLAYWQAVDRHTAALDAAFAEAERLLAADTGLDA